MINFGVIHYEDLVAVDIKMRKNKFGIEYYWRGEQINFKQADEIVDYYYITGKEPQNYIEAREFIKKYYNT